MKTTIANLLLILFIFYCVTLAFLYFKQSSFIFFPTGISKSKEFLLKKFSHFEVNINHDGFNLHGWFINRESSPEHPLIIYYGGNAEEVSNNLFDLEKYEKESLLFMNYRSYGKSTGSPSQASLFSDALFIFDHFSDTYSISSTNIILMGRSLGAAVATYVAKHRQVKAVILISPFDSLVKIAQEHYPVFPVKLLLKQPFESVQIAQEITAPMIAIIAGQDRIISNERSVNLVEHWGGKSHYVTIKDAGHNTISNYPQYWDTLRLFMSKMAKISV
ncbi:MAG TPA: alpha/beta hydrolase [Candidatus Marinimicrobia bacterium]|nr:alpha/beta hydrolase [Candidatus Neomarinimicrobiota bacterium]